MATLLKAAIEYANEILHFIVKDRVDMIGYSGQANFVTRFSLFYQELIHSACLGGASWKPVLPVSRLYGETLNYPLGVADFKKYSGVPFNLEEWRKINFFIDMNLLDERGRYNYPRLKELNKFKDTKINTKNYKEIWSDFCDVYVNSTGRAQMVTYIFCAGNIENIFALVNDSYAVKNGESIIANRDKKLKLTIYVDGVECSDFSFTQSSPEYGTINKQKAVLTLKATNQNKRGSVIKIKTNDNKYFMSLKWHN